MRRQGGLGEAEGLSAYRRSQAGALGRYSRLREGGAEMLLGFAGPATRSVWIQRKSRVAIDLEWMAEIVQARFGPGGNGK